MAVHNPPLARLQIPQPTSQSIPQPAYAAAPQTAIRQNFNMHTPLQTNFGPQVPPHPHPGHGLHRAHPSLVFPGPAAALAAVGIAPPSGMPVTPVGMPPHMFGGFQRGSRRTPSISTGGPPKAPLGGPNAKHSPMPATNSNSQLFSEKSKSKKVVLKLPLERVLPGESETAEKIVYSLWSRIPFARSATQTMCDVRPPDIKSMEMHPMEQSNSLPATIDVFLPGKAAWEEYKQRLIEEKLQRLGVEPADSIPPTKQHHPHGRSSSISSPADPALLLFKLNKLQQSQTDSLSTSPQPPPIPVSPNQSLPPRFQNLAAKHGHSFSLANLSTSPSQQPQGHNSSSFNPFGQGATLGADHIIQPHQHHQQRDLPPHLHAPQGVIPLSLNMQSDSTTASSGSSRVASTIPDFNRGFGLDIPEEDEEELETFSSRQRSFAAVPQLEDGDGEVNEVEDDSATVPAHSRHISKVSVALPSKPIGHRDGDSEIVASKKEDVPPELEKPVQWNVGVGTDFEHIKPEMRGTEGDGDPIGEWTASEDERTLEEYSNPSDEERALRVRRERREHKSRPQSYRDQEIPRRLPDFPRPPEGGLNLPNAVKPASSAADEDIISNPSEEGQAQGHSGWLHPRQGQQDLAQYQPVIDGRVRSPRPLPPLPHSRTASGNHSLHSLVHSRRGSAMVNEADLSNLVATTASAPARRDSLNPYAKPFVFGAAILGSKLSGDPLTEEPIPAHIRQQSFGHTLNAGAAEFKPTGFTFRPPEGVPTLSFNSSEQSRPLPQVPMGISPSRYQGREKRQRRGSSATNEPDREEEKDSGEMDSFRFPHALPFHTKGLPVPAAAVLRAISPLPNRKSDLNAAATPFKFLGTDFHSFASNDQSTLPYLRTHAPIIDMQTQSEPSAAITPDIDTKEISSETAASMHPSPSPARKRPPVLEFKHPISTNTVPAALFRKALVGTDVDGPTRASVQSRLSSHDVFDHVNSPSLDDGDVPTISRKTLIPRLDVTSTLQNRPDVSRTDVSMPASSDGANPQVHGLRVLPGSVAHSDSQPARNRQEDDQIDQRLEDLLDDRMEFMKKDILDAQGLIADQVVGQIVAAFRTHISEATTQRPDEDARKELNLEVVRRSFEQGIMDVQTGVRRHLEDVLMSIDSRHLLSARLASDHPTDLLRIVEDIGNRTIGVVTNAAVEFASQANQIEESLRVRAADEREVLLRELFNILAPRLESFRQQPVDFDIVTAKLAEAVKPHISQLIDLTSDKKETAGLIVQRLMPALSAVLQAPAHVDTDAIVSQLRVEIARLVPTSDPHIIKEAVADLVVERLDSRLAVREKYASSGELLYSRISERIDDLHAPVSDVRKAVEDLRMGQESIMEQGVTLNSLHQDMAARLLSLPETVRNATEAIQALKGQWGTLGNGTAPAHDVQTLTRLDSIESTIRILATGHEQLSSQAASLVSHHEDFKSRIATIPQHLLEATTSLKQVQSELLSRIQTPDQSDEVKSLLAANTDLQVQIAKARGVHGQIRVEKDLMSDRMAAAERERDALRAQLEELKSRNSAKDAEVNAGTLRITELEDALSHSLARLQSSDVTAQAKDERIAMLEQQNRELNLDQYQLKSQVQKLELQSEWLVRDKGTLEQRLLQLSKEHDNLMGQRSHWEDLRRTSEQVEQLTKLISAADSQELAELKRERDRCRVLEGEHASLQKQFKEQEVKSADLRRSIDTTRQSLVQVQQRASEWEKKTKELDAELDATRARLEEAEDVKLQLDSDLSLARMHLEEKESAEKIAKEREVELRAKSLSLEMQNATLKDELKKSTQASFPIASISRPGGNPHDHRVNGHARPQDNRPSSRASTVYGGRSPVTPTDLTHRTSNASSLRSDSPKGVWGSMHAPQEATHRVASTPSYIPRSSIPSPTPSTVSLAPTQGEDGWWS